MGEIAQFKPKKPPPAPPKERPIATTAIHTANMVTVFTGVRVGDRVVPLQGVFMKPPAKAVE